MPTAIDAVESNLLDWLRDAHAMEEQAETMLKTTAARLEQYPQLKARLLQHVEETREQARLVRSCIERLGGDTSAFKDVAGKAMATAQGMSGIFASDEVMKAVIASYAFEHMEIASYRILAAGARALGDAETERVCQTILAEEEQMAAWLGEHIPQVTQRFMELAADPDASAKR